MTPSFLAAQQAGTNFSNSFRRVNDENAIESILSQAMQSGNPEDLQSSIGQILSKVSPERQGVAVQYLQNAHKNLVEKQKEAKEQMGLKELGLENVPKDLRNTVYKERERAKGIEAGREQLNRPQAQIPFQQGAENPQQSQPVDMEAYKAQLRKATGSPYPEIREEAKATLKSIENAEKLEVKRNETWTKFGMDRAKKVLDNAEEIAQTLPIKKSAHKLMTNAISNKDLGFFSLDNLAEMTGIPAFRSKEGALFKTAGKEYFLGSISRAGARPNQWIEQQISDMLPRIGIDTAANLTIARALENETDINEELVRLTEDTFEELRNQGKDVGSLGSLVNKKLMKFTEDKQKELFNDIIAIKAIDEGKPQKFHKVEPGTKISSYMVDALLVSFNNDREKAKSEAKKLGYVFE